MTVKFRHGLCALALTTGLAACTDPASLNPWASSPPTDSADVSAVAPTASEEADLRAALARPEYSVSGMDDALIVSMPQDLVFAAGGTAISGEVEPDLRVIADHLNRYPESFVQVLGHTDSSGAAADNLALSQVQAEAVRSLLVASGISGARIVANGLGESKPLSSNLTAEGKARNRRIEIAIIPTTPPPGTS